MKDQEIIEKAKDYANKGKSNLVVLSSNETQLRRVIEALTRRYTITLICKAPKTGVTDKKYFKIDSIGWAYGNCGDYGFDKDLINRAKAASALGSIKTPKKSASCRANGAKGGRPKLPLFHSNFTDDENKQAWNEFKKRNGEVDGGYIEPSKLLKEFENLDDSQMGDLLK